METISVKEFHNRVGSFYEKMGVKMEEEQYQHLFKMLNLSYLSVDQTDPDFSLEKVADFYKSASLEYQTRMRLMGMSIA